VRDDPQDRLTRPESEKSTGAFDTEILPKPQFVNNLLVNLDGSLQHC
jgi:hypothetical protein